MPKQVLVIDDDPNTVKYLSAVLSDHGYDPASASDGAEGLEKVKQVKPDLVVLDVMMPKRSGLTLFKMLRKDEQCKDIPVLMLTGVSGVLDEQDAQKDETDNRPYDSLRDALRRAIRQMRDDGLVKPEMFVDKPVDIQAFVAKVRTLVGS